MHGVEGKEKKAINQRIININITRATQKENGMRNCFKITLVIVYFIYKTPGNQIRSENYIDIATSIIFFNSCGCSLLVWYKILK